MEKNVQKKIKQRVFVVTALLAAFVIPLLVVVIGFAQTGVYPFGTRSYLSIDGMHQYLPFFTELYHKLHEGESLFYSWNGGLGYDFWSVFSYYLASPLNFLIYFCPADSLNEGVTAILLLKTGLAGLSMTAFLLWRRDGLSWETQQDNPLLAAVFGVMYGLSNYVIGYHINMMWMDCVILLPCLCAFLKRLVLRKKGGMYSLVLGLAIISNYYIGIGVCLFCLLYYLLLALSEKRFSSTVLWFGLHSLLGGMAAGIVLIPAVYQIMETRAASTLSRGTYGPIAGFFQLLSQMLPGTKAVMTTGEESLANIYCGVGAVLFLLFFLLQKNIPLRTRLVFGGGLLILFASFGIGILNQLFHGFHAGYGFPNRHAFLFVFLLLSMGYEGFLQLSRLGKKRLFVSGLVCLVLLGVAGLAEQCGVAKTGGALLLVLLLVFLCGGILLAKQQGRRWLEVGLSFGIFVFVATELSLNALYSIRENGNTDRDYMMQRYSYVTSYLEKEETQEFYRADVSQPISRNESLLYGQKGIALFSSTVNSDLVDTLHQLGFYTSLNRIQYGGYCDVTNMLFGVRYTEKLNRLSNMNPYSPITDEDIMVENPYCLGLGFLVEQEALEVSLEEDNPFDNQNVLLSSMTGERLYQTEELTLDEHLTTSFARKPGYHYYVYVKEKAAEKEGQSGESETVLKEVKLDGSAYHSDLSRIYDLGEDEESRNVELEIKTERKTGEVQVFVGYYREKKLEEIYEKLSDEPFAVEEYRDGMVAGSVTCEKEEILFLSIPAASGWSVTVDGKTVSPSKISGFIGISLEAGEHEIILKYHTKGWALGMVCTGVSLFVLGGIVFYLNKRKEKWKL